MDGLGPGPVGNLQQQRAVQVSVLQRPLAQRERLVGQLHVQRLPVVGGVDRHAADAQFPAGPQDAHRDLAAVGDEYLLEHTAGHYTRRLKPPG